MNIDLSHGIRLYKNKSYAKALKEFENFIDEVLEDSQEKVELDYHIGLTLTKLRKYDEALLHLEQVVNSHNSVLHIFQSRMILGYIYSITKRYRLAEFEFNKLIEEGAQSPQIYASLGYINFAQNKIEQSVKFYKKSIKIDSNYPNAINSLGFIYADKGIDPAEAIILCKKAVNIKPENAAYIDSLGWAFYNNNQFSEARSYLRKALDLAPGNKEIASHMKKILKKFS